MIDLYKSLEKSRSLEMLGKYDEAETELTKIINTAKKDSSLKGILAEAFNMRGVVRRMLCKYEQSLSDYRSALDSCIRGELKQKILAYRNMADVYRLFHSDFGAAHTILDEALTFTGNSTLLHATIVDQRGLVFVCQKDFSSAIASYQKAKKICEILLKTNPSDHDTRNTFAQIVHHLGAAYILSNRPDVVEDAYNSQISAIEIFENTGNNQGIVNAAAIIGQISIIKSDIYEAIKQNLKALKILKKTKHSPSKAIIYLNLAEAYLHTEKKQEAISYIKLFRDEILEGNITITHVAIIKDLFQKFKVVYVSSGLNIPNLDKVERILR